MLGHLLPTHFFDKMTVLCILFVLFPPLYLFAHLVPKVSMFFLSTTLASESWNTTFQVQNKKVAVPTEYVTYLPLFLLHKYADFTFSPTEKRHPSTKAPVFSKHTCYSESKSHTVVDLLR